MKFAHILSRLTGTPWLCTPQAMQSILDLLESRLGRPESMALPPLISRRPGAKPRADSIGEDSGYSGGDGEDLPYEVQNGTAIVRVHGILGQHLSLLEQSCGGVDFSAVADAVEHAMANPTVQRVVLDLNSPGGTANGCAETFTRLREIKANSGKPLLAFTDATCASAAYYLAGACDAIFATISANVGSIASILYVEDHSEALAKEGIKRFTFKSATLKDIGNPDRPMTPEEKTILQARIDYLGGLFVRDMKSARPVIAAEVFETGLTWFGTEAQARGLVDDIVPHRDAFLAMLAPEPVTVAPMVPVPSTEPAQPMEPATSRL